jgi:hypothetical protein
MSSFSASSNTSAIVPYIALVSKIFFFFFSFQSFNNSLYHDVKNTPHENLVSTIYGNFLSVWYIHQQHFKTWNVTNTMQITKDL